MLLVFIKDDITCDSLFPYIDIVVEKSARVGFWLEVLTVFKTLVSIKMKTSNF